MKAIKFLLGLMPAEFESHYDVEESAQKVSDHIRSNSRTPSPKPTLDGKLTGRKVILWAGNLCSINAWCTPFFYGGFKSQGKQALLIGHFSVQHSGQAFLACWLGIALFMLFMAMRNEETTIVIVVLAMLAFVGVAMLFTLNSQLKKISVLSDHIKKVLSNPQT